MACVESGAGKGGPSWLFVSWMSNHISKIEVSKTSAGKWTFVTKHCLFRNDVSNTQCKIAGLAADDEGRKLLVATSCFAPRTGFKTTVHVTNMDAVDWCVRTGYFRFPILDPKNAGPLSSSNPICPNLGWNDQTLIKGLAYDSCQDRLYLTDGLKIVYGKLPIDAAGTRVGVIVKNSKGANVRIFQIEGCCALSLRSQEYTGLSIYPNKKSVGTSCVTAPCNSCSKMRAGTIGDAILGNPDFALSVTNAPGNWTTLALGIGVGSCSTKGIPLGFCGTIKLPLAATALFLFQNPGPVAAGCAGGRVVKTGTIPSQPSLCGLKLSTQWVVECRSSSGVGAGVTNCHEFEIQGN